MPDSFHDERFLRSNVLVIVAHPDDETICLSAQLARQAGQVTILHVTDGAPRDGQDARAAGYADWQGYAAARRQELLEALTVVGIGARQTAVLDYADQQASRDLPGLTARLHQALHAALPRFVFTHPYEGGHPDHDACAFAVAQAVARLAADGAVAPMLLEFAGYHASPGGGMEALTFLPGRGEAGVTITLDEAQRARKQRMYDCFRSQHRVLAGFPIAVERHRPAPAYDFTQPPHPSELLYERYGWEMTGTEWRELAREALAC